MSDIFDLSPEENAFFESGGNSPIPTADAPPPVETPAAPEPAPEPEKTDAAKVEADKVEKMVSLSALHEERGRRKATENEKRALENQLAELRGKFSVIERLNAPPQQQQPAAPTVETDIFGVVKHQAETIAQMQKRLKSEDDARQADGERNQLVNAYRIDAANFEAKTPDFKAAYTHLLNSRAAELQAMGYDDPVQLHEALTSDEMSIARMALSGRKSPAEIIYQLAQQRGYKKVDPAAEAAAKSAAEAAAKASAAEKIDTINRGQQANKSLANAGGTSGDGDMTAEALLKMPMDEFETWCTKHPAKAKRLMGG